MKKQQRSLAQFAKAHGCFLCFIPQRVEIEKAKAAGTETKTIVRWLIEDCGYNAETVVKARNGMASHFLLHSKATAIAAAGGKRR